MEISVFHVLGFLFVWFVFGCFGWWVAAQKGGSEGEGFTLGLLFGPLGVIVEALLPTLELPARPTPEPVQNQLTPEQIAASRKAEIDRRASAMKASQEWNREFEEAEAQRQEAREARKAEKVARLEAKGVNPGPLAWFWMLPDLTQAMLAGLAIGIPLVAIVVMLFKGQ